MIFGDCPYCEGAVSTPIASIEEFKNRNGYPGSIEKCPHCGKEYLLKHSRLTPTAYPMEMVKINKEKKEIEINEPQAEN